MQTENKKLYKENYKLFAILRYVVIICVIAILLSITILYSITYSSGAPSKKYIVYQIENDIKLNSTNAILLRINDDKNEVLYSKDSEIKAYPASMTKIMTAIVAIENIKDFEESIVLDKEIYSYIYRNYAAVAGFQPGEKVKLIDLLYGLMIKSGAECSIGLATYVAGSDAAYVEMMNKKAKEIGMKNTHFVNSVGLHDPEHYSTASDIAILLEYALQNETFYKVVTTPEHTSAPTNGHPKGLKLNSSLLSFVDRNEMIGVTFLGGKTGFTNEASYCLASFAKKYNEDFIFVTCNAPEIDKKKTFHIEDAIAVYKAINFHMID